MLRPGAILDNKYVIESVIGQGGFGYVYRARERLTDEVVAIKELIPSLVGEPQMVQRFIQEARATLRLTHPNIARTYGIFQEGETYYLAMEYLSGGSLADRLARGPMPPEQATRIVADLCAALEHAHRQGVVHCDIKPANVLFDARGTVRLADFGIAHVSEQMMTRGVVTGTGMTLGTVRYMAPEQLEGVRDDPRLDIYALGALLYEMLAGRPYLDFEAETTPAAQIRNLQRIQSQPPIPVRAANPGVPAWLAQAIERALSKAPGDRFPSAVAMREVLLGQVPPPVHVSPPHPAQPLSSQVPPTIRVPPPPSRRVSAGAARGGYAEAPVPRPVTPPSLPLRVPPADGGRGYAPHTPPPAPRARQTAPVWQWGLLAGIAVLAIALLVVLAALLFGRDRGVATPTAPSAIGQTAPPPSTAVAVASATPAPELPAETALPPADTPPPPTDVPAPTPTVDRAALEQALLERLQWRRNNGAPVFAYRIPAGAQPPAVDGNLDEWTGEGYTIDHIVHQPEQWQGPQDSSGTFYLTWDDTTLYLAVRVRDDQHVQEATGVDIYKGDDVEIQLDVNLAGDYNATGLSGDDGQIGLAVRNPESGGYEAYIWRPPAIAGPITIVMAALPTGGGAGGYTLEAAVLWSTLNLSPRVETPYGFALSLSDNDTPGTQVQESMVSSAPRRQWGDPTTWGTLILVDW